MRRSVKRVHDIVFGAAAVAPDAAALYWRDEVVSFSALAARMRRAAAAVAAATAPGDRVAILGWNNAQFVELLYAAPMAGRIVVPLNVRLAEAEIDAQLAEVEAALVVGDADLVARLGVPSVSFGEDYEAWRDGSSEVALPDVAPDTVAWLLFTSGSTDRPKAAMLTHRNMLAAVASAGYGRPVEPHDVYLYPFPLFHVSTHNVLLQHSYRRPVVLMRSFEAREAIDLIRRHRATTMSLAPTMIAMLLDDPAYAPDVLASVRTVGYGAAAIGAALLKRVMSETAVGLSQSYGQTEVGGAVAYLGPDDHRAAASTASHLLASAGRAVPGVELRIGSPDEAGVGEIEVRAEQVMAGYWRQPELSAATIVDGWLRTGDLGRIDEDGYLYLVDRRKDMIITGGENVASREVEDALASHPAVRGVAVVGKPDDHWGEVICAFVVRGAAVTADELVAHCRERLAGYKKPRHIEFVDALPINASGKVDKPALRRSL